jgi:putative ABC transport system substrate-binding protein
MRRREFLGVLGGAAAAWPIAARAQQSDQVRRVGVLISYGDSDPEGRVRVAAFREELQKLGWTDGRSLRLDIRWIANSGNRSAYAAELVGLAPDVIVGSTTPVLQTLQKLTPSVPIVFVQVSDPVTAGFVPNLARPGGNITGFTNFEYTIGGKWLDVLKEAVPSTNRVGVLVSRNDPSWSRYFAPIEAVAPSLGMQLTMIFLDTAPEIEHAIDILAQAPNGGLIVLPSSGAATHRELIIGSAARHRLPAIYPFRYFVVPGGLLSYGIDQIEQWRGAAGYVDRILKGMKTGDLPVQLPTKFEMVINLKTAKALGLEISPTLLARADEVIE